MENAWIIPIFPLLSFLFLLLFGNRLKETSALLGTVLMVGSVIYSVAALAGRLAADASHKAETVWLSIGDTQLTVGWEVNQLNALMLVIVSLVSCLVHLYSRAYMKHEGRLPVFYAYLGLFTFAMLGLVLSPNLLQLYIFWELVGLGSFLLIGFYFHKEEAKAAAKKAFIMTRIGDVGLFIGMILLFTEVGSFEFDVIFMALETGEVSGGMITLSAIFIFIGAMGKSGQFPLHTWLPDAMEGPTPVSALIHAATMVAAGVYLVAVMYPLFAASETAMMTVAAVGGATATFAALIALVQKDIKRTLAYSTISQLGLMMLALGSAGYVAAVFHLMTHAFFKALLFLAAGSVIHAVSTQNIEKMGGLWKKLKWTGPLFLAGTLAISGIPLFSGFFSKEEILLSTWAEGHYILFILGLIVSFLTAFYMFRLFFMVFTGPYRGDAERVRESSVYMIAPMLVLGVLSIFGGYVNTPWFGTFLGDWLVEGNNALGPSHVAAPAWIMWAATAVSLAGTGLAYLMYKKKSISRSVFGGEGAIVYSILRQKFFIDELYRYSIIPVTKSIALFCAYIDRFIVEGLANLIAGTVLALGKKGSSMQTGHVQHYSIWAVCGLALLLIIFAVTRGGSF
ncbi:MAG: NADH-quinone oxidoreductase subunit L [Bacillus sp. (in: firmicutes)]